MSLSVTSIDWTGTRMTEEGDSILGRISRLQLQAEVTALELSKHARRSLPAGA